jgi:hypothetical protein
MSTIYFAPLRREANLGMAAILGILLFGSRPASAGVPMLGEPILPGFDLYQTEAGLANFSSMPIPADFFAPGSDPFTGIVILGGNAVGPGTTDTIVRRHGGLGPLEFPGGEGTIPIEIVALNLVSIQPIQVTYSSMPSMPSQFFDVFIELFPPAAGNPNGTMPVRQQDANGGTFNMESLDVNVRFTFREHGNPTNEADGGPLDLSDVLNVLDAFSGTWSHDPPPNDAHDMMMFPAGNLYVTDPVVGGSVLTSLTLVPSAVPEPRAWLVLGIVAIGAGALSIGRRVFW